MRSTKPDFVAQTAEATTDADCRAWFRRSASEFAARGATWFRYSIDGTGDRTVCLTEGWLVRPDAEPEPPEFQMTAAA